MYWSMGNPVMMAGEGRKIARRHGGNISNVAKVVPEWHLRGDDLCIVRGTEYSEAEAC